MATTGISKSKLGERLGVDRTTVLSWCQGTSPRPEYLEILAEMFNVTIGQLLDLEPPPDHISMDLAPDQIDLQAALQGRLDDIRRLVRTGLPARGGSLLHDRMKQD
jgi:transcriptional regulator with XRE-family HTH domain